MERRIRRQHPKVAMPVGARRGHQRSNTVDQLQGRQSQLVSPGTALVTGRLAVLFGEHLFGL